MVKIDLITGFLGSGKTTFIKKYAKYLIDKGCNIGILENDFGAVNVDMMLLQDLMGDQCELEMVAGGCDYDCHKRRFKTKLISMGMCGYDRVLVEPSGIYDVDEFFDVLQEEPLDRWYEIGNVFSIVDAKLDDNLSEQSEYLLASQVARAGSILLSRSKEATEEEKKNTIQKINEILEKFQCNRKIEQEVYEFDWNSLQQEEFEQLLHSGYTNHHVAKLWFDQNNVFQSHFIMNVTMTEERLRETVKQVMDDYECGNVFRIKGFMKVDETHWIEMNATKNKIQIEPIANGQEVLIVIGENLNEDKIDSYWK